MTNHNRNTVVPVFQLGIEIVPDGNLEGFRTRLEQLIKEGMPEEVLGVRAVHTGYDPVGYQKVGKDISAYVVLSDTGVLPGTGEKYHDQAVQAIETISEYDECRVETVIADQYKGLVYYPAEYYLTANKISDPTRIAGVIAEARWQMDKDSYSGTISQDMNPRVRVYQHLVNTSDDIKVLVTILDTIR